MGTSEIFQNNIRALAVYNPLVAKRLSEIKGNKNRYSFEKARSGETIPYLNNRPMHSTFDPAREAQRLMESLSDEPPFLIFLGLGAGFAQTAAFQNGASKVLVIDYDLYGISQLMSGIDYTSLFSQPDFTLLIDPSGADIYNFILQQYYPSLSGGIKTIPLRPRIEADPLLFEQAAEAIKKAVDGVSSDYSVQTQFGCRWFSNIIRNVLTAGCDFESLRKAAVEKIAVVAAGPSLDTQFDELHKFKTQGGFILSTDTAFPALLHGGIRPDAVMSIDCQHISYYHFLGCDLKDIPLLLDMGSPPSVTSLTEKKLFFCGGHPLAAYLRHWREFPLIDTSGANVTYACLSAAAHLEARQITLFGADFAYVRSRTYARGTYIYPYFEKKQNRLSPLEALHSAFLYRSPFLKKEDEIQQYHETSSLRFYRQKLEEKVSGMNVQVISAIGEGAPIKLERKLTADTNNTPFANNDYKTSISAVDFIEQYKNKIAALHENKIKNGSFSELNDGQRNIFITLLPGIAAIKHRNPDFKLAQLINEAKNFHVSAIEKILSKMGE